MEILVNFYKILLTFHFYIYKIKSVFTKNRLKRRIKLIYCSEMRINMRVIAGKARSLKLKTIDDMSTRPTTDRIKETLFNMLNPYIPGARFLDLFAGSGAIGIEALSRGAKSATFVENNRKCIDCIKDNLTHTKLMDDAIVLNKTAQMALEELKNKEPFDIIFMDPPYDNLYEKDILYSLHDYGMVNEDTIIIVEASIDTDFGFIDDIGYEIFKNKVYKTNKHVFIRMR